MGKGRILLISGMITICLMITGTIALFLLREDNQFENSLHKERKLETSVVLAEKSSEEPSIEKVDSPIGVKTLTDEIGVHNILFNSGEVKYSASSGPIKLTVTHVRLEQLIPATETIKNSVDGRDRSTIVLLNMEVSNQGEAPVYFRIDDAEIQSDTNEKSSFHPALSNQFGSTFNADEKKQGLVAVDFEADPNDIAVIELNVAPAYDQNYEAFGDAISVKIPMY